MIKFIELLERKISGCDSLGGLEREKAVYQSVLKDYREQLTLTDVVHRRDMKNFKKLTMYDETLENELYTFFGEYGVTYKKELNLIKALNDYIDWYGCRDSKMDKILPIEHQEGVVVTAMTLLKELLNQQL